MASGRRGSSRFALLTSSASRHSRSGWKGAVMIRGIADYSRLARTGIQRRFKEKGKILTGGTACFRSIPGRGPSLPDGLHRRMVLVKNTRFDEHSDPRVRIEPHHPFPIEYTPAILQHVHEGVQPGTDDRSQGGRILGHPPETNLRQQFGNGVGTLERDKRPIKKCLGGFHNSGESSLSRDRSPYRCNPRRTNRRR